MKAPTTNASNIADASMQSDERWQAVQRVLSSPIFVKAPRMRAMLSFLMMRKLSGMEASISEYAIGIEVFHRDARDYDTTIDPVVRVQMGRLRGRLAQYYATSGNWGGLQIVIPPGTYVPVLTSSAGARPVSIKSVELTPLCSLAQESGTTNFISGLEEELVLRLFQRFGGETEVAPEQYRMEVRVRTELRHARATIRLIDDATGRIAWIQQCDRHGELGIALQEKLALAICADLQNYMLGEAVSGPASGV
jgi:TolB-like protein